MPVFESKLISPRFILRAMKNSACCALIIALVSSNVSAFGASQKSQASRNANQDAPLRIVVISGEDAVNVIQQRTAVAPVVEVRDRNNQPVAGAVVTFTIQGGKASFAAGANAMTITTNAAGQAAVSGLTPTATGAVNINVAAAFQGQTATAAITQTNFATAAQAAAAGSSTSSAGTSAGSGGGGGIGPGTITALGATAAGVAGGLYAYKKYEEGDPPTIDNITIFPPSGLQAITPMDVAIGVSWHSNDADTGASLTVDYGDGAVETRAMPDLDPMLRTHVYQSAGTFTVRATFKDAWDRTASSQADVVIKSMTGRWTLGSTGSFFTLTQSGTSITGTFTAANGQGSGTVMGTVSTQGLGGISLSVTPTGPGPASSYVGSPESADQINGSFTSGTTRTVTPLIRQ